MKHMRSLTRVSLLLAGFGLLLSGLITACGSSGSGASTSGSSSQTGTVAMLLTDGPTDQFKEVNVTVNVVSLLSDDQGPVVIYSGSRRINLLALQEVEDLFMVHEGIPAGIYSKIRLQVSDPELVPLEGDPITSDKIQLAAGGKIDLVPEHPFEVIPGETLSIRLDLDADKSILIHVSDANGPIYQFRPIVFVEVLSDQPTHLVSVHGVIESIQAEEHSFLLKRAEAILNNEQEGDSDTGQAEDMDDLDEHHAEQHLIRVVVSDDTRIFQANGQPGDFSSLAVDQPVHVRGTLSEESGLHIDAKLIEIGQFLRLHGSITSGINQDQRFGFTPDPGQGITGEIMVQVHDETLIFEAGTHNQLNPEDLVAGKRVLVEGVLDVTAEPNVLHAAVIIVKPPEAEFTHLQGTISDINLEARTFQLISAPPCALSEPPCLMAVPVQMILVHVMPDAVILRVHTEVNNDGEDDHLGIELITFDALKDGDMVHVFGQFDPLESPLPSPFNAKVVLVEGSS